MKNKFMYFGLLLTVIVSFLVFYHTFYIQIWQVNPHWVSDIPNHAQFSQKFSENGGLPVYSMWYLLNQIASGFSIHFNTIAYASITLLTTLIGLKYLITYSILKSSSSNDKLIACMSFLLLLVMPIISYYTIEQHPGQFVVNKFHIYLGNISPNQWHNSTLILAMPLNILLFYYTIKHLNSNKLADFAKIGLLSIASILCKPNYALAFLPVICTAICVLNYKSKQYFNAFLKLMLLLIPSVLTLIYQWYFTFIQNNSFVHPTKTIISPFLVWDTYSPHKLLSLLLSICFPIVILLCYHRKVDKYVIYSWLIFLVALIQFSLLAEFPEHRSANFAWGGIAATYILFLFSTKLLINQPVDLKAKIAYGTFGLHVFSGIFFLTCFFIKKAPLIM